MDELDWLGPLDFMVVKLPQDGGAQAGFDALLRLVDAHQVLVLDLELVRRTATGVERVPVGAVPGVDLAAFDGAFSGLLDDADLDNVSAALDEGETAAVLVYEVLTLHPVVAAFVAAGASVVEDGSVEAEDVLAALDATEGKVAR